MHIGAPDARQHGIYLFQYLRKRKNVVNSDFIYVSVVRKVIGENHLKMHM